MQVGSEKPTGKESEEGEEKDSQRSEAHLVEGLGVSVVGSRATEKIVEGLCSSICSTLTGLTTMAIDIAFFYTYAPQSHNQPTEPFWWPPARASYPAQQASALI